MRRALALLLALSMVTPMVATPVTAHGNQLSVDPQLSDDGTIVVESMYILTGNYLVVHLDQGGRPGRPVGVRNLSHGSHSNYEIGIDRQYWEQQQGNRTYWIVVHRDADEDDGAFDPMVDHPVQGFHGGITAAKVTVGRSDDGSARLLASGYYGQRVDSPSVTLSSIQLDRPGYVVLRTLEQGSPGEVVGTRALDPGTYDNASVALDRSYYESLTIDGSQTLVATLHTTDGDDSFDPESDAPLRAGDEAVRTRFSISRVENASATTRPLVNTPEPTSEATSAATPTADTPTDDSGGSTGSTPGFGVAAAVGVVVGGALLARRRGR